MLHCQVLREGKCVATYEALNEVVMNQSAVARITDFEVSREWHFCGQLQGRWPDHLHSHGFNGLFAGRWRAHSFPGRAGICDYACCLARTHQSAAGGERYCRSSKQGSIVTREQAFLTVDGQVGTPLGENDVVRCKKSEYKVKLFKFTGRSFFDVLRTKLKWGER